MSFNSSCLFIHSDPQLSHHKLGIIISVLIFSGGSYFEVSMREWHKKAPCKLVLTA